MKKLLVILMAIFILSSCMVIKYTHEQVMDKKMADLHSKEDIINSFGIPDKKKVEGDREEWIWYYGQERRPADMATLLLGNDIGGTYNMTDKYLKITFKNDKPYSYETQGLDYSEKEENPVGTISAIIGIITGLVLLSSVYSL